MVSAIRMCAPLTPSQGEQVTLLDSVQSHPVTLGVPGPKTQQCLQHPAAMACGLLTWRSGCIHRYDGLGGRKLKEDEREEEVCLQATSDVLKAP